MTASPTSLKALNILVNSPVSQDMIHKLVVATLQVLPCQESKYPSPPSSPESRERQLPSLMTFLTKLVRYTNVYSGTLLATLVYLNRLKNKLPKNAQGLPCTRHRILLSCLILSSKNHNDSSPKNIHWAKYTDGLFSVKDINLMERQLLFLLNWDLRVSNEEMCLHLAKFLEPIKEDITRTHHMRRYLQKQQIQQQQQHLPRQRRRSSSDKYIARSNSNTSNFSMHNRQDSTSSISSVSSHESSPDANMLSKQKIVTIPANSDFGGVLKKETVDPRIEITARREEQELKKMLDQYAKNNSIPTNAY